MSNEAVLLLKKAFLHAHHYPLLAKEGTEERFIIVAASLYQKMPWRFSVL